MKLTFHPNNPCPYVFSFEISGKGVRLVHHSDTTLAKHGGVSGVFQELSEIAQDPRKIRDSGYLVFHWKKEVDMGRRSVGQKMERAGSQEVRIQVAHEWAQSWKQDQMDLVHQLEQAIRKDDYDALCRAVGSLKAVTEKRFKAFDGVIEKVAQSDLDKSLDLLSKIPKPQ